MRIVTGLTVKETVPLIRPLFDEHYEESCTLKGSFKQVLPDFNAFLAQEQAGRLVICAAVNGDECLGYSVSFIANHMHYADTVVANVALLFVAKAHRVGTVGGRLMLATSAACKERGAALILWRAKPGTPLDLVLGGRMPINEHVYAQSL